MLASQHASHPDSKQATHAAFDWIGNIHYTSTKLPVICCTTASATP